MVVMIIVAVLLIIMVIASVCHNHYKIFSTLFRWIRKTHPELSKTASGHLIRVVQSSVLEEYKMSKTILGKGASGVCRVGTNIKSKKCFAIKIIELKDDNVKQFYKREIDILKDLEHLNIIRVFEAYEEVGSLGLVMVRQYIQPTCYCLGYYLTSSCGCMLYFSFFGNCCLF